MPEHHDGPTFQAEGNRAYVTVASAKAEALRTYLKNKGIRTDPPEVEGGSARIEIGGVFEAEVIERLVRAWPG